jgi:CheY-like chemotaxis protein
LILSDKYARNATPELLKQIKERYDNPPPVMMITAYGDKEN